MSTPAKPAATSSYDVEKIRRDFPILQQKINGKPLVYLDNAASSQKPRFVLDAIIRYYEEDNANVHRGVHTLSERATEAYELGRAKAAGFINARSTREVVFVRGASEAINLVATSYGREHVKAGDEILISHMEHHSNIVPWQLLCEQLGAKLRVVPINADGDLELDEYERLIGPRTKLVAMVHVSNALGSINPVKRVIATAHEHDIPVLIDGAQAAPHLKIDVQDLDCDFYALSSHKMYGPTGIGVLYGKEALLDKMPPYQGGGEMIRTVSFEKTTYNELPHKFEAGTPHIAGAVGLGAAIDYLNEIGLANIAAYEHELLTYAREQLSQLPGLSFVGNATNQAAVVGFVLDQAHPHDVGTILDQEGVAIRSGHHCAQPVMERYGVTATTRASMGVYNTTRDIDTLIHGLKRVLEVFG